jgi:hypothetical protein
MTMQKIKIIFVLFHLFVLKTLFANHDVEIVRVNGDVKVRRGIEENWIRAAVGMELKEIDTILSLEGEVLLKIDKGLNFHLGNNSMLDIGDLRQITKRQLFLFLMAQKIDKIESGKESKKLRVGNVSVIHGESREQIDNFPEHSIQIKLEQEINGAKALYLQNFFTNSILSFYKILNRYSTNDHAVEIFYYLGKSFEMIAEPGQAIDCYHNAVEIAAKNEKNKESSLLQEINEALHKLKSQK